MSSVTTTRPVEDGQTNACEYDAGYYAHGNNYRERFEFRLANLWRAAYIALALGPGSILDVGGGMGLLVEQLLSWGREALGLELSRYAITQAPASVRRAFVQGNLTALPFPDHSFDAVVSVNVLEHLAGNDVTAAVRECARVARHGMYHEITVLEDRGVIHRDPTHRTKLTAKDWLHLLTSDLPDWRISRGPRVPYYKNGIFVAISSSTPDMPRKKTTTG